MTDRLKVGVVGCGQIAQIAHLPYLQELPQFEICALCDLSAQVLQTLGEKYNVANLYTDHDEMVQQEDLDIVLVANKNHAPPAIAAMKAGKHVLVEKPIAFNLRQADEMIDVAQRSGVKLMVGYMKRYDPAYQKAKQMVAAMKDIHLIRVHDYAGTYQINHQIYDLVTASDLDSDMLAELRKTDEADLLADIGPDRVDLLEAHDIMIHLAIHDINALHGLYGLPQTLVAAQLFKKNFVTALFEYKNGVRLVWETGNLISLVDWDEQIKVWGAEQRVELKFPFPYLKNASTDLIVDENDGSSAVQQVIKTSYDEALKREWRHFHDCIVHDSEPLTGALEARDDLAFAVALTKAAGR
ncbi:MAG: Gfo/Idh/MocA family oxidoreductase [Anaerolineales bacterium]|nr:Gfo/Idh/MocA family oxidoreductase [Anaerolineales bacterium]